MTSTRYDSEAVRKLLLRELWTRQLRFTWNLAFAGAAAKVSDCTLPKQAQSVSQAKVVG